MRLFLVQHGVALTEAENPDRPLTPDGRAVTVAMACHLRVTGIQVDCIWHSGKTRARQTAEIFREHLQPQPVLQAVAGLNPGDDPAEIRSLLEPETGQVMLVGHLPHLGKLAALLLSGQTESPVVQMRNSGVLCLSGETGAWAVEWYLTPDSLA